MGPRDTNYYDRHISVKIKIARETSGFSQTRVGNALGVSFQQVQKYESGQNRVSAGRLFQLAAVFERPISWFFEGLPGGDSGLPESSLR
jgi:transcriptional regulator with XRE-family HTH domain